MAIEGAARLVYQARLTQRRRYLLRFRTTPRLQPQPDVPVSALLPTYRICTACAGGLELPADQATSTPMREPPHSSAHRQSRELPRIVRAQARPNRLAQA